jgi:Ricin-type beta-trefoil lectin domain
MAAVGLLAFGAVAGSGSSAFASMDQAVTACSATLGTLALGLQPNCTAGDSTIDNPTSVTITVNTTSLGALLNDIPDLGEKATWTLSCVVNGNPVSVPGTYTVTSTSQSASDVIDLQSAVGSPNPGQCTVSDLTATTTLALTIGALGLGEITVGAAATADAGTPGAVYANYPSDSAGAHAEVCADDTGNGNAGTHVQAYQCLSDLADQWIQLANGQFAHNGDCLTDNGGSVSIASCVANPADNSGQIWDQQNVGGAGTLANADGNGCLTAPSSGTIDGAHLAVTACKGAVGQEWTVPGVTAV